MEMERKKGMRVRLWSGLALLGILLAYSAPGAAAAAAPNVQVTTVGSAYLPGATVTIDGSVEANGMGVSGVDVALEADGVTTGQTYWVDQVTTAADGSFTDAFVLPSAASQDASIKIWAVADGGRASTTFAVHTPSVPQGGGGGGSAASGTTCTDQPQGEVINSPVDSQGGTLTSTDGCVVLTVPAGAFSQQTTITVTETAPQALPPGNETALSPLFAIDFGGQTAHEPIGMQVQYDASSVGSEPLARVGLFLQDRSNFRYVRDTASDGTSSDTASISNAGDYVLAVNTQSFNDVSDQGLQQELDILLGRDAISGFPDGGFHPDATVTRAEFVKMLVLSLGLPLPETPGSDGFSDVGASAWYAPYVDAAVSAGLVKGVTSQTFEPEASITRAQLAVMVVRAMNGYTPTSPLLVQFTDQAEIPAWALQDVMAGAEAGIVQGLPDGSFDPQGLATRSQAAAMIANLVTVTDQ